MKEPDAYAEVVGVVEDDYSFLRPRAGDIEAQFRVRPWKVAGGRVETRGLRIRSVHHNLGIEDVERAVGEVTIGATVSLKVRFADEVILGDFVAYQEGGITVIDSGDHDLSVATHALAAPYEFSVGELGVLMFDRRMSGFFGELRLGRRRSVELFIQREWSDDDRERDFRLLDDAALRVRALRERWSTVVDAVVAQLCPAHSATWSVTDPLGRDDVGRKLRPEAVHIEGERTTVFFDSGGVFGHHGIEVRLSPLAEILEIAVSG